MSESYTFPTTPMKPTSCDHDRVDEKNIKPLQPLQPLVLPKGLFKLESDSAFMRKELTDNSDFPRTAFDERVCED